MRTAWKNLERTTARVLGGKRNCRGDDFGQSLPDVEHPTFSVECKYRKSLPRLLRLGLADAARYDSSKPPLLVIKEKYQRGAIVVMKMEDFTRLFGNLLEHMDK